MREVMCDSHVLNAGMNLEDALPAGIRAIPIFALHADSKDRDSNGRSCGKDKSNAFRHGC